MVFERKGFAREMVSNCNVGATTYTVCKRAREEFKDMIVGNHKIHHASPVKWCLKEKVLLGKWSAIAMLELQCIRFAGWALTEGQHRPKAGKKKKTREAGLFFLVPTSF